MFNSKIHQSERALYPAPEGTGFTALFDKKHKVFFNNEHIHTLTDDSADALHGILATIYHDSEDDEGIDLENNNRFTIVPSELERHQELLEKGIITHENGNFYRLNKNSYEYKAEEGGSFFNSL